MSLIFERIVTEDLSVGVATDVVVSNPGGGTLVGAQVCLASFGVGQASVTADWTPGTIASGGYASVDVAVPGAVVGDFVVVSHTRVLTDALVISAHVSAADTVKTVIYNLTGVPVALVDGTLKVLVLASR